jgi:hypothetical protein
VKTSPREVEVNTEDVANGVVAVMVKSVVTVNSVDAEATAQILRSMLKVTPSSTVTMPTEADPTMMVMLLTEVEALVESTAAAAEVNSNLSGKRLARCVNKIAPAMKRLLNLPNNRWP